jgi:hypothetical protein
MERAETGPCAPLLSPILQSQLPKDLTSIAERYMFCSGSHLSNSQAGRESNGVALHYGEQGSCYTGQVSSNLIHSNMRDRRQQLSCGSAFAIAALHL